MKKVKIIVAVTENDAIGKNGKLLFSLKGEMKHFKDTTSGSVVIMGKKTYESIGRALPNRENIVLSRTKGVDSENIHWRTSLEDAILFAEQNYKDKDIFIIGGGSLYKETLEKDYADLIYLTRIKQRVNDADTFFPKLDYSKEWEVKDVKSCSEGYGKDYDICLIAKKS